MNYWMLISCLSFVGVSLGYYYDYYYYYYYYHHICKPFTLLILFILQNASFLSTIKQLLDLMSLTSRLIKSVGFRLSILVGRNNR